MPEIIVNGFKIEITFNGEPVERMFDANGKETFDVTEAVELETDVWIGKIHPEDIIVFKAEKIPS